MATAKRMPMPFTSVSLVSVLRTSSKSKQNPTEHERGVSKVQGGS